jgi:hypothetical protein
MTGMSAVAAPRMPEPAGPPDTDAAPPAVIAERPPVMYEASGSIVKMSSSLSTIFL